ncbi:vacuolar protein sorting-associated protein 13 [Dendrothele bispora CBS 962.96]|uniref:Vacuolar protein sorting-associated protein 13 n=1 Tax=Dendrothele bispora (strain CBS 962.96) TaxID=1314807 RepID=A0A4S8MRH3_DENBC|nr:vacuolar protein sorting-associated protein 13 [Dendrothele bispora CBS 962.96]
MGLWWLDPGKEVLNILFSRILAPYVENLDMNTVNYGISQGQISLGKLRLKKGALDKFRLPVDVLEGHLGKFTLSLHWMNLGNEPVEILIEDVYLLVVPSTQSNFNPEEEEQRAQAAKLERLENAELLRVRGQAEISSDDSPQQQGMWQSLAAKIINNVQVTVKNIHIRYEDKMSVPGHPFAAGVTLAGFTAVSVNENWQAAFIESTAGAIHKLAKLQSLAVYFDTDSPSLAGLHPNEAFQKFNTMIATESTKSGHQFILKPVSGEGRVIVNHKVDKDTPRFDVQLLFDEIGVALDDNQYRDAISLLDMYHVYVRQHQYRKFKPSTEEFQANKARAQLKFAGAAILNGVHEKKRKWTWEHFAERRDDRQKYVELFQKKLLKTLAGPDVQDLNALERKLSYEDLRFYRSIARSRLRKDTALRKRLEAEKAKQQESQSWGSWLWGSSSSSSSSTQDDALFGGSMTEEQRKELYEVLDYDEKSAVLEALQTPRDSLKARIVASLNRGSFALNSRSHSSSQEIMSINFDSFRANVLQRPDNLEASVSLGGFGVVDGTTKNSVHPQIVQVKDSSQREDSDDPFLFIKFENNPLDERADNALTVRMRHMEIIYHKGYVEAVYKFFKPPESQLESVEALLSAASQTLEGLRQETRTGLEVALQNHKTIDIQMDMNAPIIIIPEDVTTLNCKHLIIDAGHISIESELADKDAIRTVQLKRSQKYSDEDYKRLESLMYDKLSLRLKDAQFVIGNDLQACREALISNTSDTLHLLERISIELQVQNSIVPSALNLARFKVSGKLPSLQVNLSDTKYKALMRLIDVSIPKFDENSDRKQVGPPAQKTPANFPLVPGGLFGPAEKEYHIDEDDEVEGSQKEEQFFGTDDGSPENQPELRQHIFELTFKVDQLGAKLSKSGPNGSETVLGNVIFERFDLVFALAKFDMKVDVKLRSLAMDLVHPGMDPVKFISSESLEERDLLTLSYVRVQQTSPEFISVYEGIEQIVDVKISTFLFRAVPEPVLSLYDFIMTTFVPEQNAGTVSGDQSGEESPQEVITNDEERKIKIAVQLASVQVMLINDQLSLATLSLSTADVSVLLRPGSLLVGGRLGNLAVSNDLEGQVLRKEFDQILSIEGQNFAEFRYQTYNLEEQHQLGYKSSVFLAAGSIRVHFLEQPLHHVYLFLAKLAKLKGLYDAATQAAVQTASEMDTELMQFDISIKSPIVVFPSDASSSRDILVMRLGEVSARNSGEGAMNKITASLRGIQLASTLHYNDEPAVLKIIDDIDVLADIVQASGAHSTDIPDTQVSIRISDIRLHLTQIQYNILILLSKSIPKVLSGAPEGTTQAEKSATVRPPNLPTGSEVHHVDLAPEIDPNGNRTTLELVLTIDAVKLHLYDELAINESTLKEHGIAKFALNDSNLRFKMLSDGSGEAQVVLKSFVVNNTRAGNSKFREIIPAAQHDRNQFMILYSMAGGSGGSSLAILTIDSPRIIFAIDLVFALLGFFTSPFNSISEEASADVESDSVDEPAQSTLDFRVDLHDVSICVLEDDSDTNSQAIELAIKQILLSQQGIMALTINRLGMSLMRMGKPSDTVRFLDEFDLTFSYDNRTSASQQMTSIELNAKPIVFRASYRDIKLITAIVNKAIELSSKSQGLAADGNGKDMVRVASSGQSTTKSKRKRGPVGKSTVIASKEQLKGSIDGFRLVLIGDLHEQPMLHLKVKPFIIGAKDWSGNLSATTMLATQISYWNLTNSHWEPLIDPWTFSVSVSKESPTGEMKLKLSARERLDLNLSTTFAELAITTANMWTKEGEDILQKARGSYAPYQIRNRTGSPIFVWSVEDNASESTGTQVLNDQTIDWRFDDWKTMREHVSGSGQHTIGIRFVNKSWEPVPSLAVDREGEFVFTLRPRSENHNNRLLCEVKVVDNVKVVTIRSTYKVENQTLYPLEITLVDEHGHPVYSLEKVAPGQDFCLPIEAVNQNRIRIQPDQGFGYKWCPAIRWEELVSSKSFTVKCPHTDSKEAAFRFQAWVQSDLSPNESLVRKYPKINLKLRAPIELENLLPYNIQYRVYDKNTDQNWRSYLRQGGIMPVHSVELGHLVLLNIEVQDTVFKPSDFAIINTDGHSEFQPEQNLSLRDAHERKLNLKLNYVRYPDSGGAFKVQIYSPYIIVNKTGLPFNVRSARSNRPTPPQEVAGDTNTNVLSSSAPFLLSHVNERGHDFVLKIGESSWSKPFSVEAPAAEAALVVPSQRQRSEEVHVGVSWSEALGKYKFSKIITLAPRFLLKNNLSEPIQFREHGVAPRDNSVVNPSERCPLAYMRAGQEKLLMFAFPGLNAKWSPPICIEDIGSIHFRLPVSSDNSKLLRADVKVDGSTIFVHIEAAAEGWPFVIENGSDYSFTMCQADSNIGEERAVTSPASSNLSKTRPVYSIKPHATVSYAWDFPAAKDKKILLNVNAHRRLVDPMEIGVLMPFKFDTGRTVALDVRADGPRQILRITNYDREQSVYKPRRSSTASVARQDSISSSTEAFEAVTTENVPTLSFDVQFAGIGISLVNRKLVEVIYVSMNNLSFEYTDSTAAQSVTLSCGTLQVDNQLHDAIFPVILQPTPLPKESKGVAALPTVQGSIILLKDEEHGVLFVKYCSVLLQALTVEVDEDLLFALYDLTQIKGASWEEVSQDVLIEHPEDIPEPKEAAAGRDLYFEVLELQPIKLFISFMRTERVNSEEKLSIRNPLAVVLNALTMTVGNINDAPLEMNALAIKDVRLTTPELQNRILYHYRQDVIRQLYRILGSADFIGNPVGLFTNVSSGVADIFYEPFHGVVMHGNKELGIGIAKGAASFVKKTVFGISDSMTKFTSSVGKGLSAATFDSEWQARRRMNQRRNKPRHAINGVTAGGEAFANSVASAMEGVLMKPIEGAESEGAIGFFKGMGKGIVGSAVTKPVVGVFDLASNVSEGIRNTTTVFDNPERDRVRLPRLVPHDGVLRPYVGREASGQYWMRDLNSGAYRRESYVAHINTPGSDNVVLLTMTRVLSFWSSRLRLDWELPLTQVRGITVEDTGIRFAHKSGKEHDKFVFIPDKASQSWFFERVAGVVKAFNMRRKME